MLVGLCGCHFPTFIVLTIGATPVVAVLCLGCIQCKDYWEEACVTERWAAETEGREWKWRQATQASSATSSGGQRWAVEEWRWSIRFT